MSSPTFELKSILVQAGAGAGKTYSLVQEVVSIYNKYLQAKGRWPKLVLTTFTRKATQELRERMVLNACDKQDAELLRFVSDPGHLQISTLHGLFYTFLKQVGHLAGLDTGFGLLGEEQSELLSRKALRDVLATEPEALRWVQDYSLEKLLRMLNQGTQALMEWGETPGFELAQLEAMAQQQKQKWDPVLVELSQACETAWPEYSAALRSFQKQWSFQQADLSLWPKKPVRSKKNAQYESLHLQIEDVAGRLKKELDHAAWDRSAWGAMIDAWNQFQPLLQAYSRQLRELKDAASQLDLQDLELVTRDLLSRFPYLAQVFSENWDYWLIDEFQDTSPIQVEILDQLRGDRERYVVGDPQQSIYLFRGAEVGVFFAEETRIRQSGGEIRRLHKNFRSDPDVLHFINDVMRTLGAQFVSMEPAREQSELGTLKNRIHLQRAEQPEDEVRAVVLHVQELVAGGAAPEQICVLGRTHQNLSKVARALREFGYPTHLHASRGFERRREVLDLQSLRQFIVNPHDNLNLLVLLRSPWFLVSDERIRQWMASRPRSLWAKLSGEGDVPESIAALRETLVESEDFGVQRAFERVIFRRGVIDLGLVNDPAGRKESNIWKLITRLRANPSAMASDQSVLDASDGDASSAQEPGAINLMTIHGSKGLEFEHVIVVGAGEKPRATTGTGFVAGPEGMAFSIPRPEETSEFVSNPIERLWLMDRRERETAEYDRWFYVALTRAKLSLFISWSEVEPGSWVEKSVWLQKPPGQYGSVQVSVFDAQSTLIKFDQSQKGNKSIRDQYRAATEVTDGSGRFSVSSLVREGDSQARTIESARSTEHLLNRWKKQTLGTEIHRTLEGLHYDLDVPSDSKELNEALDFVRTLTDPPMQRLIQEGYVEWGFQCQTGKGILEGQIDLWGEVDGQVYVVDYKTGSKEFVESAFRQLEIYAWALQQERAMKSEGLVHLVVLYPYLKEFQVRTFSKSLFHFWETKLRGT